MNKILSRLCAATMLTLSPLSYALECGRIDNIQALPSSSTWRVIDGDTLLIDNIYKMRINQANAPELANQYHSDQPQAQAAKQAVVAFFNQGAEADKVSVYWRFGQTKYDRYRRYLVELFNAQGEWLAAHLVHKGLAFVVSFGTDAAPACLWELELQARKAKRGIWSSRLATVTAAAQVDASRGGFMRLSGRVEQIDTTRSTWYVALDGPVILQINRRDWIEEGGTSPNNWQHQQVLVRGWLGWRRLSARQLKQGYKPGVINVSHPDMLKVLY